eukprot:gnl/TRDRNA2_/TRDRNA2_84636_c0_seq1.p1 gnl/TRDRNA2_/TRDRNA2_84636_c0~~gnl/TRDRNA2_/TRDRNA2_84636_c0_seq1.p1  ORF type:complete len:251 (+),score=54.71 gnl/TRDRNA2_/TRDRNA2_84636_c0_seq1:83-754(+)
MAEEEELPEGTGEYKLTTEAGDKPTSQGFTGKGKAVYPNGDVYEGLFEEGVRSGKGLYRCRATGDSFDGFYANNLKTGMGRMKYKAGGFYHGYFKEGKRDGDGTFKYPNGDIYSGMWKEGKRHGNGTYVYAGTKYELKGEWKDGQIATGSWTFTNGTKYVGGFKSQKPCGDGIWQTAKGTIVEGAYVQQVVPIDDQATHPDGKVPTETRNFWRTAAMVANEDA